MTPLAGPALGRYIQGVMDAWDTGLAGMSRYRANLIAVTETARAETFGQFVSFMQLGVRQKEWLTTVGACKVCVGNQEQGPIPLMQPFPSGHLAPPSHPICRCSLGESVDTTFQPNTYAYAYDPAQVQAFIDGPFAQYWPYGNLPGVSAAEEFPEPQAPPRPSMKNFGLLDFGDLPQAFQDALDPAVIGALRLATFGDRLAEAAAQVDAAKTLAAEIQQDLATPLGTEDGAVYTLDDILSGADDATLAEADQQVMDALGAKLSSLDDILSQLREEQG